MIPRLEVDTLVHNQIVRRPGPGMSARAMHDVGGDLRGRPHAAGDRSIVLELLERVSEEIQKSLLANLVVRGPAFM